MEILTTSIRIIDYENNKVFTRETPESFDEYVCELITYINNNTSVRDFKTRSLDTEVISCVRKICENRANKDIVCEKTDSIACRLLKKEVEAQKRVERLNTNLQKGSLVQALLYDEECDRFTYLLAKIEHSDFVDDIDFSFKSGFSKDKKTLWKSCLFDLPNETSHEFSAKIYSNTVAKY